MNKDKWIHMQADIATLSYVAVDWVERFLDSRGLRWAIWAVLVFAIIYFGRIFY